MKPLSGPLNAKDVQEETAPAIYRSIPASAGSSMLLKDLRFLFVERSSTLNS
jgi:hypothetical protein